MTRLSINRDAAAYLDSLSALSKKGFSTLQAAKEAILQLVCEQFATRSSSFSRTHRAKFAPVTAHNDFVSLVNHEFRTTLTAIQGFSELMRDEEFTFQEMKEYASDINTDAKHLTRIINQLLDLDQMKSGQVQLHVEQVDLNEIIFAVVQRIRPTAPAHHLHMQFHHHLPHVSGDYDKLSVVVTNLLNNAIKYSPAGGTVLLCSSIGPVHIHVSVQDQGVGIPLHALEQVFEMYTYPSRLPTSCYIKGTGLGLPMVREIVHMHGGKCWAESVQGQGSVFHFILPLCKAL